MSELIVKAPAKINIGLNIINKREDGFHNLETIFYPVNLFDIITIKDSDTYQFTTNSEMLSGESDNLVTKAVRLIEEYIHTKIYAHIYLDKRIPIGAGLGGGSSDAAAVLKGINQFFQFNIPKEALFEMSLSLGSDVPFFIRSTPAYATSRGEILTEIKLNINQPILLVNPGIHISTKWAFDNITPSGQPGNLLDIIKGNYSIDEYKHRIYNDFEHICTSKFKALKEIKEHLYKCNAQFAIMTGSGSTFFGIFPDMKSTEIAEKYFQTRNYFTYIHLERAPNL